MLRKSRATASIVAAMPDECFELLGDEADFDCVRVQELRSDALRPAGCGEGPVLRARASIRGRAERFAYAARDTEAETRGTWDSALRYIQQHQQFVRLRASYCTARVAVPSPLMMHVYDRWLAGLMAFDRHRASGVYRVLFRSANHPVFAEPLRGELLAPCEVLAALFASPVDGGMCDLTVVVCVLQPSTGAWLTVPRQRERLCGMLRTWLLELERAVTDWERVYGK